MLGPSGCGKTTLLRLIAGFERPKIGSILFDGKDMTEVPVHERGIGMVFQHYALWPHMNVAENIRFGLEMRKLPNSEIQSRVGEVLRMVKLSDCGDRFPSQLSGGQQQRVALARALVLNPRLILLDEPLSNLDTQLRLDIRAEIKRIHRDLGITMIYVTHDQVEALSTADRLALMRGGKIEQIGAPDEVYHEPKNRFVAEFLGDANLFSGTVKSANVVNFPVIGDIELSARSHVGSKVTCMLRPERIRFQEPDRKGDLRLQGRVTSRLYGGPFEKVTIEVAGFGSIEASRPGGSHRINEGELATFTFSPTDLVPLAGGI